jgi:hypothetical protein
MMSDEAVAATDVKHSSFAWDYSTDLKGHVVSSAHLAPPLHAP